MWKIVRIWSPWNLHNQISTTKIGEFYIHGNSSPKLVQEFENEPKTFILNTFFANTVGLKPYIKTACFLGRNCSVRDPTKSF